MRHRRKRYNLEVDPGHRKAMLRNLAKALIERERIVTTETRAKALRYTAERLITWGKQGDVAGRRLAVRIISSRDLVAKLFNELAPRFADRQGGYTRILKMANRRGDGAPLVLMEWVGYEEWHKDDKKKVTAEGKEAKAEKPASSTPEE